MSNARERHSRRQRSLLGVSNEDGYRRAEVDYGEYGLAHLKKILWDGRNPAWFLEILADDENMVVTLTAPGGFDQPVTNDMLGALARVVTPNDAPYVLFGRVVAVDPGNDEFTIEDPTGELYTAMDTHGGYLTVFDHHDANIDNTKVHTAGLWDDNPALNSGDTDFDDPGNYFPTWCVGWHLQPDARYPVFHEIIAASAGTITVKGDVTGTLPDVNENDVYYFIIPPVGVDKADGALNMAPTEPVSRYLAFQYFYIPPMVGVYVDDERVEPAGIYGRQAGDNLASQYYCWHRFYQPDTGRWTTPDPAMTPWWNLFDYTAQAALRNSDASGLSCENVIGQAEEDWLVRNVDGQAPGTVAGNPADRKLVCDGIKKMVARMNSSSSGTPGERRECGDRLRRAKALWCDEYEGRQTVSDPQVKPESVVAQQEWTKTWKKYQRELERVTEAANRKYKNDMTDCDLAYKDCMKDVLKNQVACVAIVTAAAAVAMAAAGITVIGIAVAAAGLGLAILGCNISAQIGAEACERTLENCKKTAAETKKQAIEAVGQKYGP